MQQVVYSPTLGRENCPAFLVTSPSHLVIRYSYGEKPVNKHDQKEGKEKPVNKHDHKEGKVI